MKKQTIPANVSEVDSFTHLLIYLPTYYNLCVIWCSEPTESHSKLHFGKYDQQ